VCLNGTIESIIRQKMTAPSAIGDDTTGVTVWHHLVPADTARVQAWFENFVQNHHNAPVGYSQHYSRHSQGPEGDVIIAGALDIVDNSTGEPVRIILDDI